jgi:hypothetical protein
MGGRCGGHDLVSLLVACGAVDQKIPNVREQISGIHTGGKRDRLIQLTATRLIVRGRALTVPARQFAGMVVLPGTTARYPSKHYSKLLHPIST